jgi:hypothetical protein
MRRPRAGSTRLATRTDPESASILQRRDTKNYPYEYIQGLSFKVRPKPNQLQLIDVETDSFLGTLNISYPAQHVAFHPDGKLIAFCDSQNNVFVVDVSDTKNPRIIQESGNPEFIERLAFAPDANGHPGTLVGRYHSEGTPEDKVIVFEAKGQHASLQGQVLYTVAWALFIFWEYYVRNWADPVWAAVGIFFFVVSMAVMKEMPTGVLATTAKGKTVFLNRYRVHTAPINPGA